MRHRSSDSTHAKGASPSGATAISAFGIRTKPTPSQSMASCKLTTKLEHKSVLVISASASLFSLSHTYRSTHHSRVDRNLFEGFVSHGAPDTVLVRGRVVYADGQLRTTPGSGRYLPMPCFVEHVYSRVRLADEERARTERAVPRE